MATIDWSLLPTLSDVRYGTSYTVPVELATADVRCQEAQTPGIVGQSLESRFATLGWGAVPFALGDVAIMIFRKFHYGRLLDKLPRESSVV